MFRICLGYVSMIIPNRVDSLSRMKAPSRSTGQGLSHPPDLRPWAQLDDRWCLVPTWLSGKKTRRSNGMELMEPSLVSSSPWPPVKTWWKATLSTWPRLILEHALKLRSLSRKLGGRRTAGSMISDPPGTQKGDGSNQNHREKLRQRAGKSM